MAQTTLENWLGNKLSQHQDSDALFTTLTYAQSLDGSITHRRGEVGLLISSAESKKMTHWLRTQHDAILIGSGTLLADNPKLTVTQVTGNMPRPVILDSRLRTPPTAKIFEHPKKPLIACLESALNSTQAKQLRTVGAELLPIPPVKTKDNRERIDLPALLKSLPTLGISSLMVEGGAKVISAFLDQTLATIAVITIAPFFLGGLNAVQFPLAKMPRLKDSSAQQFGEDTVVWGEF